MTIDSHDCHRPVILPVPEGLARPLWSVMIPTYNCASYLRETLNSVLAQDLGRDVMQIEVVDDGSTEDDPKAVVEEIGQGRVKFYRQPHNVGYIKNFETCLQRSQGKFVHLLHGDDCVRNGFYKTIQSAFEQHPQIGAAFCRQFYIDENGYDKGASPLEQSESGILKNWLERIAVEQRIQTPSIVLRRSVYEELGGFDRRFTCCGEDWEMWVRVAAHYPVWYEVEPLAIYRIHSQSLSRLSTRTGADTRDLQMAIEIIQSYLPASFAKQLSNKAKENVAVYVIKYLAANMILENDLTAAGIQIREALRCSSSPKVIRELIPLLFRISKSWLKSLF